MPLEQMVISKEVLGVVRAAVRYAIEANREFVSAPDLLLALMDDEKIGPALQGVLPRERVTSAPPRNKPPKLAEDDDSPTAPFPRYYSLIIRDPDGKEGRWLDSEAYGVFLEGARRVVDGPYLPKHMVHAYIAESQRDYELLAILGNNASEVSSMTHAITEAVPVS